MANVFKNTSLVTRFAVKEFMNALVMGNKVDRQLDEDKIFSGKIGSVALVRRPVMFESNDGATLVLGDIEEATIPVPLDQRKHVGFSVSSEDLTLRIEDANERFIKPAMQELAQQVESALAGTYTEIPNFTGTPGTAPSTFLDVANAGAVLDELGVPMDGRVAFYDPRATVALSDGLKGVFPQSIAKTAIERAVIGEYGGFMLYKNQSLKSHTVGVNTGTPLVDGAAQNVTYETAKDTDTQSLVTDGWTSDTADILLAGDVITIEGVNSVNQKTREDTGQLAQFVVTADATSGSTTGPATLTIAPPIITSGPYQTVTAAPADDAVISVLTGTGGVSYRQNLAWHKNAVTLAFAQLDMPTEGAESSRSNFEGVSIRAVRQFNITSDTTAYRFDILFGTKVQNRRFAVRTTS